jgi:transcription initiation factor IIE alpha subunit
MGGDSRMIKLNEAKNVGDAIVVKHQIEVFCANCGYDLDEAEISADTCSDCGEDLNLKQNVKLYATSIPAAQGDASL